MTTLKDHQDLQEIDQEEVVEDLQAIALDAEIQARIPATELEIETEDLILATVMEIESLILGTGIMIEVLTLDTGTGKESHTLVTEISRIVAMSFCEPRSCSP